MKPLGALYDPYYKALKSFIKPLRVSISWISSTNHTELASGVESGEGRGAPPHRRRHACRPVHLVECGQKPHKRDTLTEGAVGRLQPYQTFQRERSQVASVGERHNALYFAPHPPFSAVGNSVGP